LQCFFQLEGQQQEEYYCLSSNLEDIADTKFLRFFNTASGGWVVVLLVPHLLPLSVLTGLGSWLLVAASPVRRLAAGITLLFAFYPDTMQQPALECLQHCCRRVVNGGIVLIVSLVGGFSSVFASSCDLNENNYFFSFYQKIIN
jgi:hypothetical protein